MSYDTNVADMFRPVGAKPADLPVQASRFQFAINRALGIEVPRGLIAGCRRGDRVTGNG
jgi:hypothetical protein